MFELTKGVCTLTALGATLLIVFLAACGGEPIVTPSPTATPSPASNPTPRLITVNPDEDPAEFARALPGDERECLTEAVGPEKLEEFIASEDPGHEIFQACLGEETVRAVMFGQMAREAGGFSDQTVSCLLDETRSLDLGSLVSWREIGPELGVFMQATALCLSDEELLQSQRFGSEDLILNAEQLRCLVSSNAEAMAMFGELSPEVAELSSKCGIPPGLLEEPAVPPRIATDVEACLIDAIGEKAMKDSLQQAAPSNR